MLKNSLQQARKASAGGSESPAARQSRPTSGIMIGKLRNLGPHSREMLAAAGITTETQLRALGAARAFLP